MKLNPRGPDPEYLKISGRGKGGGDKSSFLLFHIKNLERGGRAHYSLKYSKVGEGGGGRGGIGYQILAPHLSPNTPLANIE